MTALLETRALDVEIAGKQVCRGLELTLAAGRCVGILGANGVGKTTLLHTLAGLRAPAGGEVRLGGEPIHTMTRRRIAQRLGLVMQAIEDPFPATVLETALIGRHPHIGFWQWESAEDIALARAALETTGLAGLETREIHALSGGERRRLAVATVLAQSPQIYLLDEPADQLDVYHQQALLTRFRELARRDGRLVVMTLHDVNHAARYCDEVLLLFGAGATLFAPVREALAPANLERLYRTPMATVATPRGDFYFPL
ncbi:MAG TPA: ABC transporter ATP-binding protein [Gammaproteobacteria bacterium]|nr:ABC transporter ATP-binding protein [Gammaproteobacteria bacterium]